MGCCLLILVCTISEEFGPSSTGAQSSSSTMSRSKLSSVLKSSQSANQLSRWVATKEDHASKIQKIIAEYFLTQRIKSTSDKYDALLKTAHAVMVAAMKCKQEVDTKNADSLKSAIESFQSVYEK